MNHVVFVHGWGFDPSFWDGLASKIKATEKSYVDLGFMGAEDIVHADDAIYITHSMGLSWLLDQGINPRALVVINGFTRFTQMDGWEAGVNPRVLKRMIRQFEKSPQVVWEEFMKNCGLAGPIYPAKADAEYLLQGLQYLENCDVRTKFADLNCPSLVLCAEQDQIVPQELSIASFGDDVVWYKEGDHLLPLSKTEEISREINSFLSQFS